MKSFYLVLALVVVSPSTIVMGQFGNRIQQPTKKNIPGQGKTQSAISLRKVRDRERNLQQNSQYFKSTDNKNK
jgi:hypothetical protein